MSGTFMDGGGNGDSGGGQPMHTGGDSYVDGGGHDHHHGDGFMGGDGHEHQGASLASILGLSSQQQHNFIAHLLGLDHDTHVGLGGGQPSQIPYWAVAMQGLKVSHFFEGFSIQPSLWMLIMFSTFITWLFCISWIRHHEPIANAAIGTGAAMSASLDSHQVFSSATIRTEMPPTMPDGSAPDRSAIAPIGPSPHLLQSARRPVLEISSLQSRAWPDTCVACCGDGSGSDADCVAGSGGACRSNADRVPRSTGRIAALRSQGCACTSFDYRGPTPTRCSTHAYVRTALCGRSINA